MPTKSRRMMIPVSPELEAQLERVAVLTNSSRTAVAAMILADAIFPLATLAASLENARTDMGAALRDLGTLSHVARREADKLDRHIARQKARLPATRKRKSAAK